MAKKKRHGERKRSRRLREERERERERETHREAIAAEATITESKREIRIRIRIRFALLSCPDSAYVFLGSCAVEVCAPVVHHSGGWRVGEGRVCVRVVSRSGRRVVAVCLMYGCDVRDLKID